MLSHQVLNLEPNTLNAHAGWDVASIVTMNGDPISDMCGDVWGLILCVCVF